jgi:hypothetical protein
MKKLILVLLAFISLTSWSQSVYTDENFGSGISFSLGSNVTITDQSPISLNPSISSECTEFLWATSGTGGFADSSSKNTTYTPSMADVFMDTVTLSLMATCNIGDSTFIYDSKILLANQLVDYLTRTTALVLMPNETNSKDATIYSLYPTRNRGVDDAFTVGEPNVLIANFNGLMQFDLSYLPDNAIIDTCFLQLSVLNDYADNISTVGVFRLKRSWIEGTGNDIITNNGATWVTYDGINNWDTAGAFNAINCEKLSLGSISIASNLAQFENITIPLSATSKDSLDLGYGWLLKSDSGLNNGYAYLSSNNAVLIKIPRLSIKYHLPNPTQDSNYFFTKHENNPMIYSLFGTVVYIGENNYRMYWSNRETVGYSTSTNGVDWTAYGGNPVLTPSQGIIDCVNTWLEGETYYMLYRSTEWDLTEKAIGLATSPDGITWTKYANNPVIDPSDVDWTAPAGIRQIDPCGLIKVGSTYYMWSNNVGVFPRQSGLFTSTDLHTWTEDVNNPIFENGRYCATICKYENYYYLFMPYTPKANYEIGEINHRIELYRDTVPTFHGNSREYLGYVLLGGAEYTWDSRYLDTPTILTTDIERDTYPDNLIRMYYCASGLNQSNSTWFHGLATGLWSEVKKLTPKAEPLAGE